MNREEVNIRLIRDYFDGKLESKPMHELEKRALEDPFLAEAMEGYENNITDAEADLSELTERLHIASHSPGKKKTRFGIWLAAASVLLIAGIGTFFILNNPKPKDNRIADEIIKNTISDTAKANTVFQNSHDTNNVVQKNKDAVVINKKESSLQGKNTPSSAVPSVRNSVDIQRREIAAQLKQNDFVADTTSIAPALQNRIASLDIQNARVKQVRIIDSITENPVGGALVKFDNGSTKAVDAKGYITYPDTMNFTSVTAVGYADLSGNLNHDVIRLSPLSARLNDVVVVGYGQKKKAVINDKLPQNSFAKSNNVMIRGNAVGSDKLPLTVINGKPDSIVTIDPNDIRNISVMKDSSVIERYGDRGKNGVIFITTKKDSSKNFAKNPILKQSNIFPLVGWKAYKRYVSDAAGKIKDVMHKDSVTVQFDLTENGEPINFEIINGGNDKRNQQAIEIIKNGPKWNSLQTNVPRTVTYKIDF